MAIIEWPFYVEFCLRECRNRTAAALSCKDTRSSVVD